MKPDFYDLVNQFVETQNFASQATMAEKQYFAPPGINYWVAILTQKIIVKKMIISLIFIKFVYTV